MRISIFYKPQDCSTPEFCRNGQGVEVKGRIFFSSFFFVILVSETHRGASERAMKPFGEDKQDDKPVSL